MPVSKKRKKRQTSGPVPQKKIAAPEKKKITRRQILIYVISGLMILSLVLGVIATGSGPTPPTPGPGEENILLATPAPADSGSQPESTVESGDSN